MTREDQHTDLKSLRTVTGKSADWESVVGMTGLRNGARYRLIGS